MSVFTHWIKELRRASGLKQAEFADALGVSQPTVSRWTRSKPEYENLEKLEAFAAKIGFPSFRDVRREYHLDVWGKIGAGNEVFPFDDPTEITGIADVELPAEIDNAIGLIVDGLSMFPVYNNGDVVVVEDKNYLPEHLINEECYVRLSDGRAFLKIVKRGTKPRHWTLSSHNAPDIENVQITKVMPVIWIKRKRSRKI